MPEKKIRIAGVPEHFNMPWHIGIEEGHFEAVGAAAEFTVFAGGTGAMMEAVANDEVDLAVVLSEGCIQSLTAGTPAKIVKTFVQSPLIWGIHTPATGQIRTLEQMQGARYAISRFGSGSHLMAIVDADLRGWSTADLEFVVVKNLAGARETLEANGADIFFWEKYTTAPYVENGEFRRIGRRLTPWPAFVVCASDKALTENSDRVTRLLNQINKLCRQLTNAPKTTIEKISKRYELPLDQTAEWFETLSWSIDWQMDTENFLASIGYLQKLGLIGGGHASHTDSPPAAVWASIYSELD